jgi:hypothetical protein
MLEMMMMKKKSLRRKSKKMERMKMKTKIMRLLVYLKMNTKLMTSKDLKRKEVSFTNKKRKFCPKLMT